MSVGMIQGDKYFPHKKVIEINKIKLMSTARMRHQEKEGRVKFNGEDDVAGVKYFCSVFAAKIATNVEQKVAMSVVAIMPAASIEPLLARRAIILVGSRVTLEVLIARNNTMALVATP